MDLWAARFPMVSAQLRTSFRRLFAHWYLLGLGARCLQLTLIFLAVSQDVSAGLMGAVMAASSVICGILTVFAGRLYSRLGPAPLNRCSALCCAAAALLATQHHELAALALAWTLAAMTLMLSSTAGYRGIGSLFGAAERISRFSRMSLLSNVNEILLPVAISAVFATSPGLTPIIVLAVCLVDLFMPAGISRAEFKASGRPVTRALAVNLRRLFASGPLLAGVTAGAAINALLCIFDVLIPAAGGAMDLQTTEIGILLSASALAQVAASMLLTVRPNHRTLMKQLRNALMLGGAALTGAVLADGFAAFLVVVAVSSFGFGLVRPLSMSAIFQFSPPDSVGDIVGLRFMLNNFSRILMSLFMTACVGGFMSSTAFLSTVGGIVLAVTLGATLGRGRDRRLEV